MNGDMIRGQWQQAIGMTKEAWGIVTGNQLLRLEGSVQRLAGVMLQGLGIARWEAQRRIRRLAAAA